MTTMYMKAMYMSNVRKSNVLERNVMNAKVKYGRNVYGSGEHERIPMKATLSHESYILTSKEDTMQALHAYVGMFSSPTD